MRILITGAGAPGALGTVASIKRNPIFKKATIFGCDSSSNGTSSFFQKIFQVPSASDPRYSDELKLICEKNSIDLVVPLTTNETIILSEVDTSFFPCPIVLLNPKNKIKLLSSKTQTIEIFEKSKKIQDNFLIATSAEQVIDFLDSTESDGLFLKSDSLSGGRGIVKVSKENLDLYTSKPGSFHIAKPGMIKEVFAQLSKSGPVIAQEITIGTEYSIDCYASENENHVIVPRIRELIRSGISQRTQVTQNLEVIELAKNFIEMFGVVGTFGIQIIVPEGPGKPTFLECNPRIQGTMIATVLAGANIIANACLDALGLPVETDPDIDWNASFQRMWRGEGRSHGKTISI